jgi:hypothetical protein
LNIEPYVKYKHETRSTSDEIATIQSQIEQERRRNEVATRQIGAMDLVGLGKETKFVNAQIAERAFSWSELLDRLEFVLPNDVRIVSISPSFPDNGLIHLTIICEGKTNQAMIATLTRFQRDQHFSSPFPTTEDKQTTGDYRFGMQVDYRPAVARVVLK